jgi:MraZ protein
MKAGREKNKSARGGATRALAEGTAAEQGSSAVVLDETRFRGRFEVKIDPKGRVSFPPSLRISQSMVVTNHRMAGRNALHIYTLKEWQRLEARVGAISLLDPAVQAFIRFYVSGGQVIELDGQGRLLLPAGLRKFANLESDAVLVGLGDKLEVWSSTVWEALFLEMTTGFDQVQAKVANLLSRSDEGEGED